MSITAKPAEIQEIAKAQYHSFSLLFEHSPFLALLANRHGRIEQVNRKFVEVTGCTADDIVDSTNMLRPPDLTSTDHANVTDAAASGQAWQGPLKIRKRQGRSCWLFLWVYPLRSPEGEITHFIGTGQEVVDSCLRCLEGLLVSLDADERRYADLVESLNVGVFRTSASAEGEFIEANQALVEMLDAESKEDLYRYRVSDFHQIPRARREFQEKILQHGSVRNEELALISLKGRRFLASVTARVQRLAGRTSFVGIIEDVSAHRRAQKERDHFFVNCLDMICLLGSDGCFRKANPAFLEVLGHPEQELVGRPFLNSVHPEDLGANVSEVLEFVSGFRADKIEHRYRCHDGSFKHVEWLASPIPERGLIYVTGRDITDRKRAEEAERILLASERELDLAREIQRKLLPAGPPPLEGYDLAGAAFNAGQVGGDYFDYIPMADGCLGIVVGDATGHGVGPSLLMAQTRSCLWSVVPGCDSVEEILSRLNRVLCESTPEDFFVTLALVRLDPVERTIVWGNCGHPACYILDREGEVRTELASTCVPLGCFIDATMRTGPQVTLGEGEMLLIVTDGAAEAPSPSDVFFGQERLLDVVRANRRRPAAEIVDLSYQAVRDFCQATPGHDDITMVVLKSLAEARQQR